MILGIYKSLTDTGMYRHWDLGRAIPFLGMHKFNFPYSVYMNLETCFSWYGMALSWPPAPPLAAPGSGGAAAAGPAPPCQPRPPAAPIHDPAYITLLKIKDNVTKNSSYCVSIVQESI